MAKKNNLTLSTVKKRSKKLNETQVHIIEEGNYVDEQITFSPLFNDKSIEELLNEFSQLLKEADEHEIKLSEQMQIYLLYTLIIKHFTHFKSQLPSTLLGQNKQIGMLDVLDHFHKTGLLEECIEKMFLPKEVNRVFEKMTDVAATSLLATNLNHKMAQKFEKLKAQNEEVFKKLDEINLENPTQ